jgi:uncharacterized protein YegJ (DUF2314 family)
MQTAVTLVVIAVAIIGGLRLWRNLARRARFAAAVEVADDDPEMQAAIDEARRTLPTFLQTLGTAVTGERFMLVKAKFVEDCITEHLWIADLVAEENAFRGVVADEPQ